MQKYLLNYTYAPLSILVILCFHITHCMESIYIICSDKKILEIPNELLPLIPTLQNSYHNIITAPFAKSTLETTITCLNIIKNKFQTRNELLYALNKPLLEKELGDQYIPKQIQTTIESELMTSSQEDIVDILHAADFLGVSWLTNACVALWVKKQTVDNTTITLEDIKKQAKEIGIIKTIVHGYIIKHWHIMHSKALVELSIADLIALNKMPSIKYTTLFIYREGLTNLEGLNQIQNIDTVQYLDLENNQLTRIQPTNVYCLPNIIGLILSKNPLAVIDPAIFKNLSKLRYIYLFHTQLSPEDKARIKTALPNVEIH